VTTVGGCGGIFNKVEDKVSENGGRECGSVGRKDAKVKPENNAPLHRVERSERKSTYQDQGKEGQGNEVDEVWQGVYNDLVALSALFLESSNIHGVVGRGGLILHECSWTTRMAAPSGAFEIL
jgi:hypothetical protein